MVISLKTMFYAEFSEMTLGKYKWSDWKLAKMLLKVAGFLLHIIISVWLIKWLL